MRTETVDFNEAISMIDTLKSVPVAQEAFIRNVESTISPEIAIAYLALKGINVAI